MSDFFDNFIKKIEFTMEEKELKAKDIPGGYALCFNGDCTDKDKCLHYQAKLLTDGDYYKGQAVFPAAWQNGKCRCYNEKKLVQKAWGFSLLYRNIPSYMKAEARRSVSSLFGNGNGQYYRAHHGEIMISPKRQKEIIEVLAKFGNTEEVELDHDVKVWDFD
jgi:hypothetical protein